MKNGIYHQNYFYNRVLSESGGVPRDKAKWVLEIPELGGLFNTYIVDENYIYVRGPSGSINLCISIIDGEIVWQSPQKENYGEAVCINGGYVCLGWIIHEKNTGKIVADVREIVGDEIEEFDIVIPYKNGYITKMSGNNPGQIYIDVSENKYELLNCNLERYQISDDQALLYGCDGNYLKCFNIVSNETIWQFEVPANSVGKTMLDTFVLCGDEIFMNRHIRDVLCLSASNGELLWELHGEKIPEGDKPYQHRASNGLVVCGDLLYLGYRQDRKGWLMGGKLSNPFDELWMIDHLQYRQANIVGDLLFAICDDNSSKLRAFDRFTGEKLFESAESFVSAIYVQATGHHILINTSEGIFYCYEWTEVYHSAS